MELSPDDENEIRKLEIDLEVAHIGELLEQHGVSPTADLVHALWMWAESLRQGSADEGT